MTSKHLKLKKIELIDKILRMTEKELEAFLQRANGQVVCLDPFAKIRANHGIKDENHEQTGQN